MIRTGETWRLKRRAAALSLLAALLLLAGWGAAPAFAQSIMRSPNLNISSRVPSLDRGARITLDPNLAGRAVTGLNGYTIRAQSP